MEEVSFIFDSPPPHHNKSYEPTFGTTSAVAFVLHTKGLSEPYFEHYCPNIVWTKREVRMRYVVKLSLLELVCFSFDVRFNKGEQLNRLACFRLLEKYAEL